MCVGVCVRQLNSCTFVCVFMSLFPLTQLHFLNVMTLINTLYLRLSSESVEVF